ncbi:MAG TPA: threonine dehydratase, partial [Rhodospirillaceae bacterium]|nr:threonine dehydratase [Rhodospirillaceae bacterium]
MDSVLTQKYILSAHSRIQHYVRKTPVLDLPAGDFLPDSQVVLKLEHLQHTASFKARGAFNAMLSQDVPDSGVIAASGGNHGAAVAYAANTLGHRAEIFVPEIIGPAKLARLKSYGATLHVGGRDFADALAACQARQHETGALLLHAYDQAEILAGQGTVAVEFEDQAPTLDTVLVAVGGGG